MPTSEPISVTLRVDPASERCWLASRWLASVEQARPVALAFVMAPTEAGRRVARVCVAAVDLVGADGLRAVYEGYGRRRFVLDEQEEAAAIDDGLNDVGLPGFLGFAADDPRWDEALAPETELRLVVDGHEFALPELAEALTGADATALFDSLR